MRAENLLFMLDECDELQLLLREAMAPAFLATLGLLLAAIVIAWTTASVALGVTVLVLGTWSGLSLAWVAERVKR